MPSSPSRAEDHAADAAVPDTAQALIDQTASGPAARQDHRTAARSRVDGLHPALHASLTGRSGQGQEPVVDHLSRRLINQWPDQDGRVLPLARPTRSSLGCKPRHTRDETYSTALAELRSTLSFGIPLPGTSGRWHHIIIDGHLRNR